LKLYLSHPYAGGSRGNPGEWEKQLHDRGLVRPDERESAHDPLGIGNNHYTPKGQQEAWELPN
jgi:hypothetical protein